MYFFMGLCFVGRYNGTFVTIIELSPGRWKNLLQSSLLVLDVFHQIFITTYFKFVKNVTYIEIAGVTLNCFALIGLYFWIPETPVYFYNMFKFDESRDVLYKIA